MGCAKSKSETAVDIPLPPLDLTGLDGPSKFEAMLPFKRTKIDVLEQKLKAATGDKKSLTFAQLKEVFATDKVWADL